MNYATNMDANENNGKVTEATTLSSSRKHRPWYAHGHVYGGMHVNGLGMGLNGTVPAIFLAVSATVTSIHPSYTPVKIFAVLFFIQVLLSLAEGMQTVFCIIAVPCYITSLLVVPGTLTTSITLTITFVIFITIWRIGVCMSVCLHRYISHAAFKCGPATRLFLHILGCAANQGGPIWWASQHRCHHKYCDMPRDPHSAIQDGVENAFAFFNTHGKVEKEFVPKHNDTWSLRLMDTWSFTVCTAEMLLAYYFFGREGLFVSYTSMWICQTITLWFNIANHPPGAHPGKVCQATNFRGKPTGWYPAFWLLDFLYPFFGTIVSEKNHDHHHAHFMLAKREAYDCMYYLFVWPLEKMGLVWDVNVASPE